MNKIVNNKFYGQIWSSGGKSADGQTLAYIESLKKQTKDQRLFKMSNKYGYGWSLIKEDDIYNLVKNNNANICEVLSIYPKKVYFDIDGTEPKNIDLKTVKDIINEYFPNEKLSISGYETDVKKSYHIILSNLILEDEKDLNLLKKIVQSMNNKCKYFDWKVYTKNRNMKSIYQSKPSGTKQEIIEDENYKNHFINSFFTGNEKKINYKFDENIINEEINIINLPKIINKIPNNFKYEDVEDNIKLLNLAPINNDFDHSYIWRVAVFCYWNNIIFDTFWDWAKQKTQHENKPLDQEKRHKKWLSHWETIKQERYKNLGSKYIFIKLLSNFYKEFVGINNKTDLYTRDFLKSFSLKSEVIESKYIELKNFETEHKVTIFNIGMGGGKTYQTINYLKNKNNYIWITPRISLANNTKKRFNELIQKDILLYNDCGKNMKEMIENINNTDSLLIQTESLFKIQKKPNYEYVIIDEFESVLKNWDSETHKLENIEKSFNNFKNILINSKKIILLDAFTTTHTTDFLNLIGIKDDNIIIYTSKYSPQEKQIIQNDNYDKTLEKIVTDLKNGKKLYIFYAFKSAGKKHYSIEQLAKYLKEKTNKNIFCFHADKDDKIKKSFTETANEEWGNYDCIITTSSITVGVNYEKEDFDKVYLLCSGYVNNPRDIIQSSMRIRKTKENIVETYFFDNNNKDTLQYPQYYITSTDDIYKKLINNIRIEKQSNFNDIFIKFCKLTNYKIDKIIKRKNIKSESQFINDLFESKMLINYDNIKSIDMLEASEIEDKTIWKKDATQEEKFKLSKYYFDIKFKMLSDEQKSVIWNNRTSKLFEVINSNELIKEIVEKNNYNNFFEIDINKKNFVISDLAIEYIKENFDNEFKNKKQKLMKILNILFGFSVIESKIKGKNIIYKVTDDFIVMKPIYNDYITFWNNQMNKNNEDDF